MAFNTMKILGPAQENMDFTDWSGSLSFGKDGNPVTPKRNSTSFFNVEIDVDGKKEKGTLNTGMVLLSYPAQYVITLENGKTVTINQYELDSAMDAYKPTDKAVPPPAAEPAIPQPPAAEPKPREPRAKEEKEGASITINGVRFTKIGDGDVIKVSHSVVENGVTTTKEAYIADVKGETWNRLAALEQKQNTTAISREKIDEELRSTLQMEPKALSVIPGMAKSDDEALNNFLKLRRRIIGSDIEAERDLDALKIPGAGKPDDSIQRGPATIDPDGAKGKKTDDYIQRGPAPVEIPEGYKKGPRDYLKSIREFLIPSPKDGDVVKLGDMPKDERGAVKLGDMPKTEGPVILRLDEKAALSVEALKADSSLTFTAKQDNPLLRDGGASQAGAGGKLRGSGVVEL